MRCLGRAVACVFAVLCGSAPFASPAIASLPPGFRDTTVFSHLEEPTAMRFSPDGRVFVAEKTGKIVVFDSPQDEEPTLFADIRTQVYDTGDRGILGLALDPQFPARPYVYVLYTYDHVLGEAGEAPEWGEPDHSGDGCEKPEDADVDACPVSGRLVRLTAEGGGDHAVQEGLVPKQEVLIEDWCQQFSSHSVGDLAFGPEGALYASGGDGANFNAADFGQFGWPHENQCDDPPARIDGIEEPPTAEGGALRAQDLRTPSDLADPAADPTGLDGSLIRIDPKTGEGMPGNPLAGSFEANERRIVAYGFRNPFRFTIDPQSERLYVANVGWDSFEEIDRVPAHPATPFNSGWPCYEGIEPTATYSTLPLNLCEGLYAEPGSTASPFFSYGHHSGVYPGDPCSEAAGSAVSGLVVYRGGAFPAAYNGALFFADSVRGCIYAMFPGEDGVPDPQTTTLFLDEGPPYPGIDMQLGPDGDLYYVSLFSEAEEGSIHRIAYDPNAPVARLSADRTWGEGDPLAVQLDASGSSDPRGQTLTYQWDLNGDGSFETPGGATRSAAIAGPGRRNIAVRVSNEDGESSVARIAIYPGDTPPEPTIGAPDPKTFRWRVGEKIVLFGFAGDKEDGETLPDADLSWKTRLLHCPSACHAHPLQVFPADGEVSFLAPDHDFPSHIEVLFTATDSEGLSATRTIQLDPSTVSLQVESDPPGIALGAGLVNQPAPFGLTAIEDAHEVLSAPATATLGGLEYAWRGWSDGGARVHTVVAGEPAIYTATYAPVSSPPTTPTAAGARVEEAPAKAVAPPNGRLRGHPPKRTVSRRARFVFASSQADGRFRCRLDGSPFRPCSSPLVIRRLAPGAHLLLIQAITGGVVDPTPLKFRWTVER